MSQPGFRALKVGLVLTLFSFSVLWFYPFLYQIIVIRPVLDLLAIVCQAGLILGFVLLAYGSLKAVLHGSKREINWWAWQTGPFK